MTIQEFRAADQTTQEQVFADQERIIAFYQAGALRAANEQFKLLENLVYSKANVAKGAQKIHDAFSGGVTLSPAQIIAIIDHEILGQHAEIPADVLRARSRNKLPYAGSDRFSSENEIGGYSR